VLLRFVHGDRDAFETLFRDFQREAYRWILRIVRDRAAADDALIDTFWRAYRGRGRFDPSRSFGAWLRRIATRAAIDQLHAGRSRRWLSLETVGPLVTVGRGPALVQQPSSIAPAGSADAIAGAFASLPPKLRVVATLALIEERRLAEIADALDVPLGTVKSRLFRATQRLRKELARRGVHA
jgi:RNA polymerase sigma-70 factor (ECF subfamily)